MSKRRFHSRAAAGALLLLVPSCATTLPSYRDVQLPAYASAIFVECASTNGALSFQVNRDGQMLEAADLEWAAKSSGDWGLASYSPFGQTLFQIQFNKQKQTFETTGRGGPWLDDVSISKDGFLRYKGQKLGLKPDEFPCFFSGHLPRSWLRQVVSYTTDTDSLQLTIQDKERLTKVRIAKHGGSLPWTWQATATWDVYWGLRQESVQLQSHKDASVVLTAENLPGIECRWTPKEEE
ncbi:hypothetical protein [Oligoflexus tunisiensis]|uniref:hypothetical protein n=1 Tax=Oligoflexus tunisiensis TaxID=708132 RepID=UPI00114CAC86|nr:hypothetical protein [Oligoflexus tunisiensis]